jgi:hypothetical protein
MATTTNFNWATPDNTGYVKDGALAIRTLGSAIDSSMALLKGGTTGQVLTKASGFGMDFVWGTVSSTPRIGQVVTATSTTSTVTTTSGYVDVTDLSVSITPTSATSKIFVTVMCAFGMFQGSSVVTYSTAQYKLVRNSTDLFTGLIGTYKGNEVSWNHYHSPAIQWVDSPATTSATTYKLQVNNPFSIQTVQANAVDKAQITVMEILV